MRAVIFVSFLILGVKHSVCYHWVWWQCECFIDTFGGSLLLFLFCWIFSIWKGVRFYFEKLILWLLSFNLLIRYINLSTVLNVAFLNIENIYFCIVNLCHHLSSLEAASKTESCNARVLLRSTPAKELAEARLGRGSQTAMHVWQSFSQSRRELWNTHFPWSCPVMDQNGWVFLPHVAQ